MATCPKCGSTVKEPKAAFRSPSGYLWAECTCKKCGRVFVLPAGPGA